METDAAGRVSAKIDTSGAVTRFEYDAQGNRKAAVDASGGRTVFEYDALNRLSNVKDAAGNVTGPRTTRRGTSSTRSGARR